MVTGALKFESSNPTSTMIEIENNDTAILALRKFAI
jgi:hypothetical protein